MASKLCKSSLQANVVRSSLKSSKRCMCLCSAAQSVRTRRILQEAHEEGRPCPSHLIQTKPCPIRPCYMWLLSDWSSCTVEVWPAFLTLPVVNDLQLEGKGDFSLHIYTPRWCHYVFSKGVPLHLGKKTENVTIFPVFNSYFFDIYFYLCLFFSDINYHFSSSMAPGMSVC